MSDKFFLDTNILVYVYDDKHAKKSKIAEALLLKAVAGAGRVSTQVIQEFINVSLKKCKPPLEDDEVVNVVRRTLMPMCTVYPSEELFLAAIEIRRCYSLSWYDALIVAAAQASGAKVLYSEDMAHGQKYGSVTVKNPFK
jgi:predicted nucleic acid-binding protein